MPKRIREHSDRILPRAAAVGLLGVLLLVAGCGGASDTGSRGMRLGPEPTATAEESAAVTAPVPSQLKTIRRRKPITDSNERFDSKRALADVSALTDFGVRPGGSEAERLAAEYVAARLVEMGYGPRTETFSLPNGKTSRNVIATLPGYASKRTIILGAHVDTKPPSPGANDNASGCAVLLELARLLKQSPAASRVEFVFYGTEEYLLDAPGDNHHLGSRDHASKMTPEEIANTAAMISVDMVGYGKRFHVRTMKRGPETLSDDLLREAKRTGVKLSFLKDPGKTGWSDHEPYELKGIPVAWLQWLTDPTYHTSADDAEHVQVRPVEVTGAFVLGWIRGLDDRDLERLCDR